MSEPDRVVTAFFQAMQARDWARAASHLSDGLDVWWPATDERFTGSRFIAMQEAYPEGWSIDLQEVISEGARVAARVAVDLAGERFWCYGWYLVENGLIIHAEELWATQGAEAPPAWRAQSTD